MPAKKDKEHRTRFLADENLPLESIRRLRKSGIDVAAVVERQKGMSDESVLHLSRTEERILFTFDQDFAALTFRFRKPAKGIILLRFVPKSPIEVSDLIIKLLDMNLELDGRFTIVERERVRSFPEPNQKS